MPAKGILPKVQKHEKWLILGKKRGFLEIKPSFTQFKTQNYHKSIQR
jgi:hypothetical protein